jgi:hypothetical protein
VAKIRTVKPELFRHEKLFTLEQQKGLPLRLAFIGLFTCCDREGRFRWQPRSLKLDALPYDEINFEKIMNGLWQAGFIQQYIHEGEVYGFIPTWRKHQAINSREPASKLPDPHECSLNEVSNTDKGVRHVPQVHAHDAHVHAHEMHVRAGLEVEQEKDVKVEKEHYGAKAQLCVYEAPVVEKIFKHWKDVFNHRHAVLDPKRKKLINQALKNGYTEDQLCEAITGCSYTPHNMGDNDRGQRYDGLHVIFRDADQIDRFIHNAQHPPRPLNAADKLLQSNYAVAQNWLQKYADEEDAV